METTEYTAFGKTKKVPLNIHNGDGTGQYDETLWIERGEDWYALSSPQLKGKRVLIVKREDWLKAPEV